jgi:hypothetical protein
MRIVDDDCRRSGGSGGGSRTKILTIDTYGTGAQTHRHKGKVHTRGNISNNTQRRKEEEASRSGRAGIPGNFIEIPLDGFFPLYARESKRERESKSKREREQALD